MEKHKRVMEISRRWSPPEKDQLLNDKSSTNGNFSLDKLIEALHNLTSMNFTQNKEDKEEKETIPVPSLTPEYRRKRFSISKANSTGFINPENLNESYTSTVDGSFNISNCKNNSFVIDFLFWMNYAWKLIFRTLIDCTLHYSQPRKMIKHSSIIRKGDWRDRREVQHRNR